MEENNLTLRSVRNHIVDRLQPKFGQGEASAIAQTLMSELLHVTPVDVALHKDREISQLTADKIDCIIDRMTRHDEPLQYILGHTRFYGGDIKVTTDTLIPRPETEELVDIIADRWGNCRDLRVLDLCTGSGCIAVTLARILKFPTVIGIDISDSALSVARDNATAQKVNVNFIQADLLEWNTEMTFDIIVSNPPYVLDSERQQMEPNVLEWEPAIALFVPDNDPLLFYRPIAYLAAQHLSEKGSLYLEANPSCITGLKALLNDTGLTDIQSFRDMAGKERFVTARRLT